MKIYALLLSLLLVIPFTGCVDKSIYLPDAEYCMGMDGTVELSDEELETEEDYDFYYNRIHPDDCEGWTNSVALMPGEFHVIDSSNYALSVTIYIGSNTVAGANHSSDINYFSMTETNYNDYVACEPFVPIDIHDEYDRFGGGSTGNFSAQSFTHIDHFPIDRSQEFQGFSISTIIHTFYTEDGSYEYDEPIYLVLDNFHCEEEKYDGTEIGDVYIDYNIGIQTFSTYFP